MSPAVLSVFLLPSVPGEMVMLHCKINHIEFIVMSQRRHMFVSKIITIISTHFLQMEML